MTALRNLLPPLEWRMTRNRLTSSPGDVINQEMTALTFKTKCCVKELSSGSHFTLTPGYTEISKKLASAPRVIYHYQMMIAGDCLLSSITMLNSINQTNHQRCADLTSGESWQCFYFVFVSTFSLKCYMYYAFF